MRVSRDRLIRLIKEELKLALEQPGGVAAGEGSPRDLPPSSGLQGRERRHFGAWIDALPAVHKKIERFIMFPDHWKGDVRDMGFEFAGQGSYRTTLRPIGNPNYVIKLINDDGDSYAMNEDEVKLQGQLRGIFPKVFAHGKGAFGTKYDWIVVETVPHIILPDEVDEILSPRFPHLKNMLVDLLDKDYIDENDYRYIADKFDTIVSNVINYAANGARPWIFDKIIDKDSEIAKGIITKAFDDTIRDSPFIRSSVILVSNYNVEPQELTAGNIGIDKSGNLVIVDLSMFDDDCRRPPCDRPWRDKGEIAASRTKMYGSPIGYPK